MSLLPLRHHIRARVPQLETPEWHAHLRMSSRVDLDPK